MLRFRAREAVEVKRPDATGIEPTLPRRVVDLGLVFHTLFVIPTRFVLGVCVYLFGALRFQIPIGLFRHKNNEELLKIFIIL